MPNQPKILTARDIMSRKGVVVHPEMNLFRAIPLLLKSNLTGLPVVDARGRLLGILSELDCMKVIASDAFNHDETDASVIVEDYMTANCVSVTPEMGIFRIANLFFEHSLRRLPVLDGEHLIGQVTRADVLKGIQRMRKTKGPGKQYPDFAWKSSVLQ
jgi:CBS domain-containing protein